MPLNTRQPSGNSSKISLGRLGRLGTHDKKGNETKKGAEAQVEDERPPNSHAAGTKDDNSAVSGLRSRPGVSNSRLLPTRASGLPQRSPSRRIPSVGTSKDGAQEYVKETSRPGNRVATERPTSRGRANEPTNGHNTDPATGGSGLLKPGRSKPLTRGGVSDANKPPTANHERLASAVKSGLSGIGRSTSIRKRAVDSTKTENGASSLPQSAGHRRNQSTTEVEVAKGSRRMSQHFTLTRAVELRPSSSGSTSKIQAGDAVSGTSTDQPAHPSNNNGLRRSATTAARGHNRSISHFDTKLQRPLSFIQPSTSGIRAPAGRHDARPQFSTLQQHYSPKKPPPPANPPKDPALEKSAEIARLQIELLQLHILHSTAGPVQRQWEDSAKHHFQQRFERIADEHLELRQAERDAQLYMNVRAVKTWIEDHHASVGGLVERAGVLADVLDGLDGTYAKGGRYVRVMEVFEAWLAKARNIQTQRSTAGDGISPEFIDGLPDDWHTDVQSLQRKAEGWLRGMEASGADAVAEGEVYEGATLGDVVRAALAFLRGMLEELKTMVQLEQLVLKAEQEWVSATVEKIMEEGAKTSLMDEPREHRGIWHDLFPQQSESATVEV